MQSGNTDSQIALWQQALDPDRTGAHIREMTYTLPEPPNPQADALGACPQYMQQITIRHQETTREQRCMMLGFHEILPDPTPLDAAAAVEQLRLWLQRDFVEVDGSTATVIQFVPSMDQPMHIVSATYVATSRAGRMEKTFNHDGREIRFGYDVIYGETPQIVPTLLAQHGSVEAGTYLEMRFDLADTERGQTLDEVSGRAANIHWTTLRDNLDAVANQMDIDAATLQLTVEQIERTLADPFGEMRPLFDAEITTTLEAAWQVWGDG